MRILIFLCGVVLLATVAHAADPPLETIFHQLTDANSTAVQVLASITDEKQVKPAGKTLEVLVDRREQLQRALKAGPSKQFAVTDPAALREAMVQLHDTERELADEHARLFRDAKPAYRALKEFKLFAQIEQEVEEKAVAGAVKVRGALSIYSSKNGGEWPKQLEELVKPARKGVPPYLIGGPKTLLSPWGTPYQTICENSVNIYVWTVSPYTGKKLGYPPPEKK